MKTQRAIAYIDGYNLYYSRLRGTDYKWLDLVALFRNQILKSQLPDIPLDVVKFFTAPATLKRCSLCGKFQTNQSNQSKLVDSLPFLFILMS